MPCWVVPSIAAELWGLSLEQVTAHIEDGSIASRAEHGFTLVDVAPSTGTPARAPAAAHRRPAPPTFTVLTPDEVHALEEGATPTTTQHPTPDDSEAGPDPNDEPDDGKPLRWREGRSRAATMRRRPPIR